MTQSTTHGSQHPTVGIVARARSAALRPMPDETRQMRAQIASSLPTGLDLSDAEIDAVLARITTIEGLPVERFAAGEYAIDDEPDAVAACPTPAELRQIAADADRDDLTPEEIAAHSRLLWNAIAHYQRKARDYDEAARREARERLQLTEVRDGLRQQLGIAAA